MQTPDAAKSVELTRMPPPSTVLPQKGGTRVVCEGGTRVRRVAQEWDEGGATEDHKTTNFVYMHSLIRIN